MVIKMGVVILEVVVIKMGVVVVVLEVVVVVIFQDSNCW